MVGRGVVHKVTSLAPQLLFFIHPDLLTVVEVIQPFNFSVSPWFRLIRCNGDVDGRFYSQNPGLRSRRRSSTIALLRSGSVFSLARLRRRFTTVQFFTELPAIAQ